MLSSEVILSQSLIKINNKLKRNKPRFRDRYIVEHCICRQLTTAIFIKCNLIKISHTKIIILLNLTCLYKNSSLIFRAI